MQRRGVGSLMGMGLAALLLISPALTGCGGGEAQGEKQAEARADSTQVDSTAADSVRAAGKDGKKKKKKVPEGVPVKVASVKQGEISQYILYSAVVEAEETVDVYAEAAGLVRRVLVEEGDRVRAGQSLVQLADEDLKLAEASAQVNFRKLENQFRRKEEIFNRKLLAKEEYERQKFELDQARIGWERAKLALAHASVRSPVDGVVSRREVKLGDRIGQSRRLFEVVNMHSLIAQVHVPGKGMHNLSVGQPAMVTTDFLPDTAFSGHVMRISPVVDPASGTFKVTLGLDSSGEGLRPGMFVNTHIVTETHSQAVLVPKRAVVYDGGLPHVFVVADSTARKIQFKMGFEDGRHLEALSGVSVGDSIVVVGQNGLKERAKIRVIQGEGLRIPAKVDTSQAVEEQAS